MGEEAKKILADNNRMFEELKFHHAESSENQAEKVTNAPYPLLSDSIQPCVEQIAGRAEDSPQRSGYPRRERDRVCEASAQQKQGDQDASRAV